MTDFTEPFAIFLTHAAYTLVQLSESEPDFPDRFEKEMSRQILLLTKQER